MNPSEIMLESRTLAGASRPGVETNHATWRLMHAQARMRRRVRSIAGRCLHCSALVLLLVGRSASPAHAVPSYLNSFATRYPDAANSRIDVCRLCHTSPPQLNPYGHAYANAQHAFAPIEPLDSDGDGASNLAEIMALTFPGDAADTPPTQPSPTPTATPMPTPTATPGGATCVGDCNHDHAVTVDDLLKAVNIALGTSSVDLCTAADANSDGMVTINELLAAVNGALDGCPL